MEREILDFLDVSNLKSGVYLMKIGDASVVEFIKK